MTSISSMTKTQETRMRKSFLPRLVSESLESLGRVLLRTPPKENSIPTPEQKNSSARSLVTEYEPTYARLADDSVKITGPRYPYSDEPGVTVLVKGAARLLYHLSPTWRPKGAIGIKDIVRTEDESYEAINGWQDLGATKTGILRKDDDLFVSFAEFTRERFEAIKSNPCQLVICWMDGIDGPIYVRHFPCVRYMGLLSSAAATRGAASLPAHFQIAPLADLNLWQQFEAAIPKSPDARLFATVLM